jgi:ATP-dependent DNA helicase RecG
MNKETQNIEWKLSWREEYFKWVCGFANAQGGTIFTGVGTEYILKGLTKGSNNS